MPMNTEPVFPYVPSVQGCTLAAANTNYDGTGTVGTLFTADATNGSRVDSVMCKPKGTNGTASVLRIWWNNGQDNNVAANNKLIKEATIAAANSSQVAALAETPIQLDLALPPGYRLLCAFGTAGGAGWDVSAFGGHYTGPA
jgi:hypothetical protein